MTEHRETELSSAEQLATPAQDFADHSKPDSAPEGPPTAARAGAGATAVPNLAGTWRRSLLLASSIWLATSAARFTAFATSAWFSPEHGIFGESRFPRLYQLGAQFDTGWFFQVAANGYFADEYARDTAFFPAYPMLMRGLGHLFSAQPGLDDFVLGGQIVSLISSLIAVIFVYRLTEERFGPKAALLGALAFTLWPSATFLSAVYSEPLYLAFAAGAWWAATHGRWLIAGLLTAGASLTRINGAFLLVALLVLLIVRISQHQERFSIGKLFSLSLGAAGVVGYFGYLYVKTGDVLAWSHAQFTGWGRATVWPWTSLTNTVDLVVGTTDPTSDFRRLQWAVDIGFALVGLLIMVWLLVKRHWPELTLVVLTYVPLLTSTYYLSISRNSLTLFPVFVLAGGLLAQMKSRWAVLLLTVSGVWMLATSAAFGFSRWVG